MTKNIPLVGPPGGSRASLFHAPPAAVGPTDQDLFNALQQKNLPPVLAGPSVRKSTTEGIWIWIATSVPVEIEAGLVPLVSQSAQDFTAPFHRPAYASGSASSIKLAHHLHIGLVCISRPGGLPKGEIFGYNLQLRIADSAPDWWFAGDAALFPADIALSQYILPTCMLPGLLDHDTRFLHGSCRKLHGTGNDAVTRALDAVTKLGASYDRPTTLFLTGDQIYADDVDSGVLNDVMQLSLALLGRREKLPNGAFTDAIAPGSRADLVRSGGFTVERESAGNHLLGFGEFAAMYILSWSKTLVSKFNDRSGEAQRLFANISTYMIFDDHDITDDWNLTYEWRQRTEADPVTRRVIANGLAAIWAFQWIGNNPGHDGGIPSAIVNRDNSGDDFEQTMWGFHDWSFVADMNPPVILMDCRTQRQLDPALASGHEQPPGLLNDDAFALLESQIANIGGAKQNPVIIVAQTPVIGYEGMDTGLVWFSHSDRPGEKLDPKWDPEAWFLRPKTFVRFFDLLANSGRRRFVILSGDVHYGFTVAATYTLKNPDRTIEIVQFTSSATKNQIATPLEYGPGPLSQDHRLHIRFGWRQEEPYPPMIAAKDSWIGGQNRPHDFEFRWRYVATNSDLTVIKPNNMGQIRLKLGRDSSPGFASQHLLTANGEDYPTSLAWNEFPSFLR